jgi:hypothetical protein
MLPASCLARVLPPEAKSLLRRETCPDLRVPCCISPSSVAATLAVRWSNNLPDVVKAGQPLPSVDVSMVIHGASRKVVESSVVVSAHVTGDTAIPPLRCCKQPLAGCLRTTFRDVVIPATHSRTFLSLYFSCTFRTSDGASHQVISRLSKPFRLLSSQAEWIDAQSCALRWSLFFSVSSTVSWELVCWQLLNIFRSCGRRRLLTSADLSFLHEQGLGNSTTISSQMLLTMWTSWLGKIFFTLSESSSPLRLLWEENVILGFSTSEVVASSLLSRHRTGSCMLWFSNDSMLHFSVRDVTSSGGVSHHSEELPASTLLHKISGLPRHAGGA